MKNSIRVIGDFAGGAGIVVCLLAGLARLSQTWQIGGLTVPAMFQLGTALMVLACLAKLHVLTNPRA